MGANYCCSRRLSLLLVVGVIRGCFCFCPLSGSFPKPPSVFAIATAPLYFHPHNFRSADNPFEFGLNEVIIVEVTLVWIAQSAWQSVLRRRTATKATANFLPSSYSKLAGLNVRELGQDARAICHSSWLVFSSGP